MDQVGRSQPDHIVRGHFQPDHFKLADYGLVEMRPSTVQF